MSFYRIHRSDELYHYGIQGQKWGVRRFQNEDGSYTSEGLKRRNNGNHSVLGSLIGLQIKGTNAVRSVVKKKNKQKIEDTTTEKQKKYGFSKEKYGIPTKTVKGINYHIYGDDDIDSIENIIKNGTGFTKSFNSVIKKELDDMSTYTGIKAKKMPPLQSVTVAGKIGTASYWYDDNDLNYGNDPLAGHILDVDFDLKTKKVIRTGIDG